MTTDTSPGGRGRGPTGEAGREGEGAAAREVKPRTVRARGLRRRSQNAEWKLWHALRGRKLRGFKFRRQHPIDRFIADFACVEAMVVVELDGAHHADQVEADEARTEFLRSCGRFVIGFDNAWFDDERSFEIALGEIGDACERGRV